MEKLQTLIRRTGKSLRKVSEELLLSPSTLSLYVSGKRKPDPDTLIRLADYFGVSVDYLLGHTVAKEKAPAPSKEEQELLELWKELNAEGQEVLLSTARAFVIAGIYKTQPARNSNLSAG